MNYKGRDIDHIVYSVSDLDKTIDGLERKLGVRPVIGGKHLKKGTKNALLNLGNACYLEILSIDPDNKEVSPPRWMGIDLIEQDCITRWALKSNQIDEDQDKLKRYKKDLATIFQGERMTVGGSILKWKMLLPQAEPKIELAPFMVDWSESEKHPTVNLPNECRLQQIEFKAPKNNLKIRTCFQEFFGGDSIEESEQEEISIIIKGPKGSVTL